MCAENFGLCLPRSSCATSEARRPGGTSGASTSHHERSMSPGRGVNVFCSFIGNPIPRGRCAARTQGPLRGPERGRMVGARTGNVPIAGKPPASSLQPEPASTRERVRNLLAGGWWLVAGDWKLETSSVLHSPQDQAVGWGYASGGIAVLLLQDAGHYVGTDSAPAHVHTQGHHRSHHLMAKRLGGDGKHEEVARCPIPDTRYPLKADRLKLKT